METLDAIKTRRSIRKFKPQLISREIILELLEAAMFAPSAGNEQPWQFMVLDDRTILDEVPRICSTAPCAGSRQQRFGLWRCDT